MSAIVFSEDITECPGCGGVMVKLTRSQRQCNACGFEAEYVSTEDEREAKERAPSRSDGAGTGIGRYQVRW